MSPTNEKLSDELERARQYEKDIRAALRIECSDIDANDWPDDLHMADVIEKHLCRKYHWMVEQAEAERERLRDHLVKIACLNQTKGPDDYRGLDEPAAARTAREALRGKS
jgi:hypothetical protein